MNPPVEPPRIALSRVSLSTGERTVDELIFKVGRIRDIFHIVNSKDVSEKAKATSHWSSAVF